PDGVSPAYVICSVGGIMVAVNPWVSSRELGYALAHSAATTLIASDHFLKGDYFAILDELEPLAHSTPQLELIIHVGARSYRDSISFNDVYARGCAVQDTENESVARAIDPKD